MYSFIKLAEEILEKSDTPLTYQQIWEKASEIGLTDKLQSKGKTPWQSLGSRLYVDIKNNTKTNFVKIGKRPSRFFLKTRQNELSQNLLEKIEREEQNKPIPKTKYDERDLHPLLSYYVYANPAFSRGRSIYSKTIFHEKSRKKGYNKWLHPDIVGVYLPLDDWKEEVIEFNQIIDNNLVRLFSFECKIVINKGNYRESYFQAVSNSSWAHEGYLVAAEIMQDEDLLAELDRLSISFGIGIIHLHLKDFDSSTVLFPARPKQALDWETINKLCDQNKDFKTFIQDVKIDFDSRIHTSEYDPIIPDPIEYIKRKLKIDQEN